MSKIVQKIGIYFLRILNSNLEKIKKVQIQQIYAAYNTSTFHITLPSSDTLRYTGLLMIAHQGGCLTGLYVLSIRKTSVAVIKISGVDASATISNNEEVTITYSQINIWANGLLILPEELV